MIPVDQTTFAEQGNGNCLAACVASILEMPLEAVPNFIDDEDGWVIALDRFLNEHGFAIHRSVGDPPPKWVFDITPWAIAIGDSPRNVKHAVVIDPFGFIVHDPHPSRAGLKAPSQDTVFLGFVR